MKDLLILGDFIMNKKKLLKRLPLAATAASTLAIGTYAVSKYFYNIAIARNNKGYYNTEEMLSLYEEKDDRHWLLRQNLETLSIQSYDGLKLNGYFLPSGKPTKNVVIIAHGYHSNGIDMGSWAKFFREEFGYHVFLPDARGHGNSEGDYAGYGWHERLDYIKWIDFLIKKLGDDIQIALFGVSMGGSTVMMASGEHLPPQVKAIVEDCGYSSLDKELAHHLKQRYRLPSFPLLHTTSILNKWKHRFDFFEASALEQVKKATLPMFFIHGDTDTFVPTNMVFQLYDNCASKEKELWLVEGAEHGMAYRTAKEEYTNRILQFLEKHMN